MPVTPSTTASSAPACARRHHRLPRRHRFEHSQREPLVERRQHEQVTAAKELAHVRPKPEEVHSIVNAERARERLELLALRAFADEEEADVRELARRLEQILVPLVRAKLRGRDDHRRGVWTDASESRQRDAVGHDGDLPAVDVELLAQRASNALRHRDVPVDRAPDDSGREPRSFPGHVEEQLVCRHDSGDPREAGAEQTELAGQRPGEVRMKDVGSKRAHEPRELQDVDGRASTPRAEGG